jgi:hypothetical protein
MVCMLDHTIRTTTRHGARALDAMAERRELRRERARINALLAGVNGDRTDTYGEELRSVALLDLG